jgi:hypothetical protein
MKISFTDFWGGFDPRNNFFVDLLKSIGHDCQVVPFSNDTTDLLIYSCFGFEHTVADKTRVKKIFYTGENRRPNFDECDYSLSFDFDDYEGKNIRLPLWLMQIDWFGTRDYGNPKFVIPPSELMSSRYSVRPKTEFCCIVCSNLTQNRLELLEKLSKYKDIHCYGKPFGNHSYGEDNKYEIISKYKFNICFENSLYPGYYTEKLIHAKVAGCLPLYWADKYCERDFNTASFLNLNDFSTMNDFVQHIIQLDRDEHLYTKMSHEYLFDRKEPSISSVQSALKQILMREEA